MAEKTEKPQLKVVDLDPECPELETAKTYYNDHKYEMIAEIGTGVALPDNDKYTVKIVIADNEY